MAALHAIPGKTAVQAILATAWLLALAFASVGLDRLDASTVETGGLHVYRQHGPDVVELDDGAEARAGDRVQLTYDGRAAYGVIWSVDSRGVRTLHFPSAPDEETALTERRDVPLAFSWRLDDAPDNERFFFVTSSRPLSPAALLRQTPARPTFTLQKVSFGHPSR